MFSIQLRNNQTRYTPGETIGGLVCDLPSLKGDSELAIRLIWYTSGKGTRDFAIVQEQSHPGSAIKQAKLDFAFLAPHRPLSFSGHLIGLQWAIEAVGLPSKRSARHDILIAYGNSEIRLVSIADQLKTQGIGQPWLRIGQS